MARTDEKEGNENAAKKRVAEELFMNFRDITQKEIAERVGVGEKTVGRWVEKGKWRERRERVQTGYREIETVAVRISERFLRQLERKVERMDAGEDVEITPGDIDMMVKAGNALEKLAGRETLRGHIVHLVRFMEWLKERDLPLAQKLTDYVEEFFAVVGERELKRR